MHGSARLLALLALAFPFRASPLAAQTVDDEIEQVRVERLAGLARAWGQARYFHPTLAWPDVDWDAALVEAVGEVSAAGTRAEYRAAIQRMLDRLDDPLTRTVDAESDAAALTAPRAFRIGFTTDSILVVTAGDYYALASPRVTQVLRGLADSIARARAIVFDLRSATPTEAFGRMQLAATFAEAQRLVVTDTLPVPAERSRVYYGFETESAFSSGQYRTGFFTGAEPSIIPAARAPCGASSSSAGTRARCPRCTRSRRGASDASSTRATSARIRSAPS